MKIKFSSKINKFCREIFTCISTRASSWFEHVRIFVAVAMVVVFHLLLLALLPTLSFSQFSSEDADDESATAASDSLFWGTYKPNLYVAVRARIPHSLVFGMMWWGSQDLIGFSSECRSM
jgi:hypothetical protein